jgi:diaminopimelate epimerase
MSGRLPFTKMSGAGNDFIVLGPGQLERLGDDPVGRVRRLCRRRISIGSDGLLAVEPCGEDRIKVVFYNPDGSVAFCANGSRCAARYAFIHGFAGRTMVLETMAGDLRAEIAADDVRIRLPAPIDVGPRRLELPECRLEGRYILAGAPHFVAWTENLGAAPLERLGPPVRRHPEFGAAGVNLDLVSRLPDGSLGIRTWERGVEGETLSCGSGAVAAALVNRLDRGDEEVRILPAGGTPLAVKLIGDEAVLEGDARVVFEGEVPI